MPSPALSRTLRLCLLGTALALALAHPETLARQGQGTEQQEQHGGAGNGEKRGERQQMTAQEAAAIARARHGGRVLKVKRRGSGHEVRLLLDDGRVIKVLVEE